MLTLASLQSLGVSKPNAFKYVDALNDSMAKYKIDTSLEICHFVAQLLHESGELNYMKEIASGSAYEGRKDLGNIHPGDGKKYPGRGAIQLTGRVIQTAYGKYVKQDFAKHPEKISELPYCIDSACWFFAISKKDWLTPANTLLMLAAKNDFVRVSYLVNGGFTGLSQRLHYLSKLMHMYVPDHKAKLTEIYKYMLSSLTDSPPPGSMRSALRYHLQTKYNLDAMFSGIL